MTRRPASKLLMSHYCSHSVVMPTRTENTSNGFSLINQLMTIQPTSLAICCTESSLNCLTKLKVVQATSLWLQWWATGILLDWTMARLTTKGWKSNSPSRLMQSMRRLRDCRRPMEQKSCSNYQKLNFTTSTNSSHSPTPRNETTMPLKC